jgi:hypothetical protein
VGDRGRALGSGGEVDALARTLERLRPHVVVEDVALTGGVALVRHGLRSEAGDLDLVARGLDAVRATAGRAYLVSHRHVEPKAFVQLVDAETGVRIDIFVDGAAVERAASLGAWRVVAPGDLLAHKRLLLARPVDEKHWTDAVALAARCGEPTPPRPPQVVPTVYATDVELTCARCERGRDAAFPLADKRAIFDVLGYV